MTARSFAALVEALVAARTSGAATNGGDWAALVPDAETAYRAQDAVAEALGWFDEGSPRHWKSGGPSREAVLTHAPLAPAGVRASPADFSDIAFQQRGVEAEIALRLAREVTPAMAADLAPEHGASLVEAMAVTIEIVDSRWSDPARQSAWLKLADSQMHGALAVGDWTPWREVDWSRQMCRVTVGEEIVERVGSLALGEPAWLLPSWLRHATRHGRSLPAGSVVTTGTWCGVLPARSGDRVRAEFPGIGSAEAQL